MPSFKLYMLSIMNGRRKTIDAFIVGAVLAIFSFIYLVILKCVYILYRTKILRQNEVPAKVISVGNITLGGTGKTPFVIMLASMSRAMGRKVAVLIRGYGDDESHLIAARLGGICVITGPDRTKNAQAAISEYGCDCIILDDGFQHYQLKRDLDIVLIDATDSFGNMRLFPRGILREPLFRLKDADIILLNKSDMGSAGKPAIYGRLKSVKDDIKVAESFYNPIGLKNVLSGASLPLSYVKERPIVLVAGIANPEYFEWMIKNLGAEIRGGFYYADHHLYGKNDTAHVVKKCAELGVKTVITTEKDVMRLKNSASLTLADLFAESSHAGQSGMELLALQVDFVISKNEEAIVRGLRSLFSS